MLRTPLAPAASALMALLVLAPVHAASTPRSDRPAEQHQEKAALNAAVRDLCRKDVVLLGESGFHGDGRTAGFKADLVRRLVVSCGFDAVFFEASHYDFLEAMRKKREGEGVSVGDISSALGGLWNQNEEVQPLLPFLKARTESGRLTLGGLDDQLGVRGAFYSLDQMPKDLSAELPQGQRESCAAILRQRIRSEYPRSAPYDEAARQRVADCLNAVRRSAGRKRAEIDHLAETFERAIGRDFIEGPARLADRDRSMFETLRWSVERLPPRSRIIIWSANAHVRKAPGLGVIDPNLGVLVRRTYGDRAFALGFTAASGSFRWTTRTAREIQPAPPGSLEDRALRRGRADVAYLGPRPLAKMGVISGAAGDHHVQVQARWSDYYDGLIVFRAERPPHRLDE